MEMSKDSIEQWNQNPVTQAYRRSLEKKIVERTESLSNGQKIDFTNIDTVGISFLRQFMTMKGWKEALKEMTQYGTKMEEQDMV